MIYQRVITTGFVLTYDLSEGYYYRVHSLMIYQRVITTGFVLTFQNEIVGDLRRRMNPDLIYQRVITTGFVLTYDLSEGYYYRVRTHL